MSFCDFRHCSDKLNKTLTGVSDSRVSLRLKSLSLCLDQRDFISIGSKWFLKKPTAAANHKKQTKTLHQTVACLSLCLSLSLSVCCFPLVSFLQWTQRLDGQSWTPSDSVSHSSRKEREGYRKRGENPPGSSFLLPVCVHLSLHSPRLPLRASQRLFYWLLLCVKEQIVFYSHVWAEDKGKCSITDALYQVWIIWVVTVALSPPSLSPPSLSLSVLLFLSTVQNRLWLGLNGLKRQRRVFHICLFVCKEMRMCTYEVQQSRW